MIKLNLNNLIDEKIINSYQDSVNRIDAMIKEVLEMTFQDGQIGQSIMTKKNFPE